MSRTAVAAALVLILFSPLVAQAADQATWFVSVEGAAVKAGGEDLVLGTPADPVTGGPNGDLVTLSYGTGGAWSLAFGRDTGTSSMSLSYYDYSKTADQTVESTNGFLPAFENPLFGDAFANRLDGHAKLKVMMVDATWARAMASSGKSRWNWIVGLRYSKVDRDATMIDDLTASGFDDQTVSTSSAEGIGVVGGIGGRYDWTKSVALTATLKLALLAGKLDVARDETAFGVPLHSALSGSERTFRQGEVDIRVHWFIGKHTDLSLGYQFKQLDRAAGRLVVPSDTVDGLVIVETSDVSLNGFLLGGKFNF